MAPKFFKVITEEGQVFEFNTSADALKKQKKLREFRGLRSQLIVETKSKRR